MSRRSPYNPVIITSRRKDIWSSPNNIICDAATAAKAAVGTVRGDFAKKKSRVGKLPT